MRKDQETVLYSLRLTKEESEKLNAIADRKGQTKSGLIREWILRNHKRIAR